MLRYFNDGRSKSFYCVATTLLPIADLETSLEKTRQRLKVDGISSTDTKSKSKIFREFLSVSATRNNVELILRKKGET